MNCEKLPCVPFRSGVHMAESSLPSNCSGGNVIGTRRIVQPTPALAEDLPERLALAAQFEGRRRERDAPTANAQHPLGLAHARRGELRQVRLQIAIEEVEDIVLGRADSGGERGPGDRRERREGGAQPAIAALRGELREIWQLALGHEALGELGIKSVESEEDGLLDAGFGIALPAPHQTPEHTEGPEQKRKDAEKEARHQGQERTQERKARARPDVSDRNGVPP